MHTLIYRIVFFYFECVVCHLAPMGKIIGTVIYVYALFWIICKWDIFQVANLPWHNGALISTDIPPSVRFCLYAVSHKCLKWGFWNKHKEFISLNVRQQTGSPFFLKCLCALVLTEIFEHLLRGLQWHFEQTYMVFRGWIVMKPP